jgi:dolichyl-phosphate beta-glucosyltransferase
LLLGAAACAALSNFAFHALGSRLLGPTDYSSLAALMALLVVAAVPVGSVQTAVTQAASASNDASAALTVEHTARFGMILLLVGLGVAVPLNHALALHDTWGVVLAAAWASIACVGAVAKGTLLGHLRYGAVSIALVAGALTRVALGVLLIPLLNVEGAMIATIGGEALAATIALASIHEGLFAFRARPLRPRASDATIALGAQLGLWMLAGVATIVGRRVLPSWQAGDFAAASTVTNAALFLPLATAAAFFPKFTRDGSRRMLATALAVATLLGALPALVLTIAPSRAVHLLAGQSFAADRLVVTLLAAASALVGLTGVAMFFLLARRRASALVVWVGASLALVGSLAVHNARALSVVALVAAASAATSTLWAAIRSTVPVIDGDVTEILTTPDRLVSVVVPSYNSGASLRTTVESLCRALDATGWSYEVIVEIDGSTDGSGATLAELSPNVVIDEAIVNAGKGAALRRGFTRARGLYVGFIDGDGDIDVEIVRRLTASCRRTGVWAAIASKHADGADVRMSLGRSTLSRVYRHLVRLLFGLDVTDTQCGAKMFTREGLEQALPWAREDGFALDVELLGLGRRLGLGEVVELPVTLRREAGRSTVSARHVLRTLEETLRVWSRVIDAPASLNFVESTVTVERVEVV